MGWNQLHLYAMEGKTEQIHDEIYKRGTIVMESTELTGMYPLHKACQYGHVRAVEELIKEGADVLAVNHWNSTCLHWLVKGFVHNSKENPKTYKPEDYVQICGLIVAESKRLLDQEDSQGNTPLALAKKLEATKLQEALEKKGAAVRKEREAAIRKKEYNKPKVRRI